MNIRLSALLASLVLFIAPACAEEALVNGDLEQWLAVKGTPPMGRPARWDLGAAGSGQPTRIAGLGRSSDFAALLRPGESIQMGRGSLTNPTAFEIEFLFAAEDPGSANGRSLNLSIATQGASTPAVNIRLTQGSAPGKLTLQVFGSKGWMSVAEDAFEASTLASDKSAYTTLHAYRFQIKARFDAGHYRIAYGPVDGEMTTLPDLRSFQTAPNGSGLAGFVFISGMSQAGFAIDNVSLKAD